MSSRNENILFIAGEVSGDLHGARVINALMAARPNSQIFGIGGQRMAEAGQEQFYDTGQMAILGFTEVIRHLPFLRRVFHHLEEEIIARKPACAVLIDYPGLNLRLAKNLKKHGVPVLWYIAPQVWAWHKSRVQQLARFVDHLAVVFPLETAIFEQAGLATTFVGHPLLEVLKPEMEHQDFLRTFGLDATQKILALLPGSRKQEVERLLPRMLATAVRVTNKAPGTQTVIAQSPNLATEFYQKFIAKHPVVGVKLRQNVTYSIMKYSTAAIVASGTATLETGFFETPMAIVYRMSPLSYAIGKRVVKLKNIGLVNIVAGEEVVPEFIQNDFEARAVANYIINLFADNSSRTEISQRLAKVKNKLGDSGASAKVAKRVEELAGPR